MATRIWLEKGHDGDPGYEAWCLDLPGFSTWAATRDEVLARTPAKLGEHLLWLQVHGLPAPGAGSEIEIVEEMQTAGEESLFGADLSAVKPDAIEHALALMDASRSDLLAILDPLPEEVLDWDPPYRNFAKWASWRTIRQIVAHVANTETHYYARHIGLRASTSPADPSDDWHAYLPRTRMQVAMFLRGLARSDDLARVTSEWSVAKALRRFVRHELQHTRSIRRISEAYE